MYFNVLSCFDAYAEKLKNGEKKRGREAALGPPTGPASLLYIFIYIVVPALGSTYPDNEMAFKIF